MRPVTHALLIAALAWLTPTTATATGNFPPAIQSHLGLSYTPDCLLCHVEDKTGTGTVTTPFGRSARERSLVADDVAVLTAVLDRMAGERVDSDNDGVGDVDELIAGTDPNAPPNDDIGPLRYGCVGRVAAGRGSPGAPLLAAAVIAAAMRRHQRRRR